MNDLIRIAQLTDLHIGETEINMYGSPVRKQFLTVLDNLTKYPLDAIILSGDLAAFQGELSSYQWIKEKLKEITCPIYICAGNHDDLNNLQQVFDLNPAYFHKDGYYFKACIKNHWCFFLDTSSYFLSNNQLEWLKQQDQALNEEVLLFMHHPPLNCGCKFMDAKYPLKNISESWSVIKQLKNINYIFCGHYHTEKTVIKDGKTVFLTPSTVAQFDSQTIDISISHRNPSWRIIEWNGETMRTFVEYNFLYVN